MTKTKWELVEQTDMRSHILSPGLYARKAWQLLFNAYKKGQGDLTNLDSLLCDFDILSRQLENGLNYSCYWCFDMNGFTEMGDEQWRMMDYKLEITPKLITLSRTVV